ncbi:LOW QUALITY PROTEIN: protein HOTHEAD [Cinnamomum micranthum f. kanehirae]|uniref:Protein HOTHEAD n=1 Tax=Cinnamomum micranthum f. kanehirae TaxID=337451 RepID=A0A443NQE4_9MAGN|nr:LOW QUALITY PROTEIN: protein HOTHEAD [Cinnamomum micranthum f. kanehirae]
MTTSSHWRRNCRLPSSSHPLSKLQVLLLERGGSPYGNQNITTWATFTDTLKDTSPTSPLKVSSLRTCRQHTSSCARRGTCFNAGFYTHADRSSCRRLTVAICWLDGLLEVGVLPDNGYTLDHIYGVRGTIFDKNNHRHTAVDLLQYANPSDLTVLLHATVHRILAIKNSSSWVIFKDGAGNEHTAYLSKEKGKESMGEIIPSAADPEWNRASPTPQVLGHQVLLDQPMVGQGMADNPMNIIIVSSPSPVEVSLGQQVGITRLGTYIEALGRIDSSDSLD